VKDLTQKNGAKRRLPTAIDEAAGGIVARRALDDGETVEVVLIATVKGGSRRWSLPKGHFKSRETNEQAAMREVREETGLEVEVVAPLPTIDYWFVEKGMRYHKFVHYFLMRAVGGRFGDHDHEVVDVRWFAFDDAVRRMAYPNERDLVAAHRELIESTLTV
jgi:8-oxo-dGTP pyrophosphatase MutT (NUDIX family)